MCSSTQVAPPRHTGRFVSRTGSTAGFAVGEAVLVSGVAGSFEGPPHARTTTSTQLRMRELYRAGRDDALAESLRFDERLRRRWSLRRIGVTDPEDVLLDL